MASNLLKKELGRLAKVTLIERKKNFQFPPSYPWLMLGMRKQEETERSLAPLKRKRIEVINDEIVSIDPSNKVVKTRNNDDGEFTYDYLIMALGAEYGTRLNSRFQGICSSHL